MSYTPEDGRRGRRAALDEIGSRALRSSSVRAADAQASTSSSNGDRTTIGRSPDCDVFLDDVTVSRSHAMLVRRDGRFTIEDPAA